MLWLIWAGSTIARIHSVSFIPHNLQAFLNAWNLHSPPYDRSNSPILKTRPPRIDERISGRPCNVLIIYYVRGLHFQMVPIDFLMKPSSRIWHVLIFEFHISPTPGRDGVRFKDISLIVLFPKNDQWSFMRKSVALNIILFLAPIYLCGSAPSIVIPTGLRFICLLFLLLSDCQKFQIFGCWSNITLIKFVHVHKLPGEDLHVTHWLLSRDSPGKRSLSFRYIYAEGQRDTWLEHSFHHMAPLKKRRYRTL